MVTVFFLSAFCFLLDVFGQAVFDVDDVMKFETIYGNSQHLILLLAFLEVLINLAKLWLLCFSFCFLLDVFGQAVFDVDDLMRFKTSFFSFSLAFLDAFLFGQVVFFCGQEERTKNKLGWPLCVKQTH